MLLLMNKYLLPSIFIAALMFLPLTGCKKASKEAKQIKVIAVFGQVTRSTGLELQANEALNPGDRIITGKNSFAELFIPAKSGIRVYENTEFSVSDITVDSEGTVTSSKYSLKTGKALFVIDKLMKKKDLEVITPTAVASVRGTTFSVSVQDTEGENKEGTQLQVVNGKVSINPKDKPNEEQVIEQGEMTVVTDDKVLEEKTKIPVKNLQELVKDEKDLSGKIIINADKVTIQAEQVIINTGDNKVPVLTSEAAIKEYYNKLEEINLDDGSILVGAVIFQNQSVVKIHTTHGIVEVPTSSIVNIRIR